MVSASTVWLARRCGWLEYARGQRLARRIARCWPRWSDIWNSNCWGSFEVQKWLSFGKIQFRIWSFLLVYREPAKGRACPIWVSASLSELVRVWTSSASFPSLSYLGTTEHFKVWNSPFEPNAMLFEPAMNPMIKVIGPKWPINDAHHISIRYRVLSRWTVCSIRWTKRFQWFHLTDWLKCVSRQNSRFDRQMVDVPLDAFRCDRMNRSKWIDRFSHFDGRSLSKS